MVKYFKMKKQEINFKLKMYTFLNIIADKSAIQNIAILISQLSAMKPEVLKDEFISGMSKIVHDEAMKKEDDN